MEENENIRIIDGEIDSVHTLSDTERVVLIKVKEVI